MRPLKWSSATNGNLNGKVGAMTFYVVAYHAGDGYQVHPKLPGQKSVKVGSLGEGQVIAEMLYELFLQEAS